MERIHGTRRACGARASGYLDHPHTSAGRVPTDSGYRVYADALLVSERAHPARRGGLDLSRAQREVSEAMRETTAALARITDLMALVTAPPASTAHIHRIEVLLLQPRVVMLRRHRLERGGHEARVHLPATRSTRAWSSGPPAT